MNKLGRALSIGVVILFLLSTNTLSLLKINKVNDRLQTVETELVSMKADKTDIDKVFDLLINSQELVHSLKQTIVQKDSLLNVQDSLLKNRKSSVAGLPGLNKLVRYGKFNGEKIKYINRYDLTKLLSHYFESNGYSIVVHGELSADKIIKKYGFFANPRGGAGEGFWYLNDKLKDIEPLWKK